MEPGRSYLASVPTALCFRTCWGRPACCSSCRQADRVAVPTTIHCDHLIQAGLTARPICARRSPRTRRFTTSCAPLPRNTRGWVLGAGRRHHSPGGAGELRLSWRVDYRHGFAHAERRRSWRVRGRRRRRGCGRGYLRIAVGGAVSAHIAVYFDRRARGWTAPKDVILYVAGELTVSGGTNAIVSISGLARAASVRRARPRSRIWARSSARRPRCSRGRAHGDVPRATGRGGLVPLGGAASGPAGSGSGGGGGPREILRSGGRARSSDARDPHVVGRNRPIAHVRSEVAPVKSRTR